MQKWNNRNKLSINTLLINLIKVIYYAELGINIFNIKDDFFNDIYYCYPENNFDMNINYIKPKKYK